jgi:hypothetical protein
MLRNRPVAHSAAVFSGRLREHARRALRLGALRCRGGQGKVYASERGCGLRVCVRPRAWFNCLRRFSANSSSSTSPAAHLLSAAPRY